MRAVAGIANRDDIAALKSFLGVVRGVTEVVAVSVVPKPSVLSAVMENPRRWQKELARLRDLEREEAYALLRGFVEELRHLGLVLETLVLYGNPAKELTSFARRRNADVILVSRQYGEGESSGKLGHCAEDVARYARCSVILLSHGTPAPRNILYATDGSAEADRAGVRLRELGIEGNPVLVLSSVVSPVSPAFVSSGGLAYEEYQRVIHNIHEDQVESARRLLSDAGSAFEDTNFRRRALVYTGEPVQTLLKAIAELDVDLLVLGAKGISATSTLLLGSITLRLMGEARCSMLIAR